MTILAMIDRFSDQHTAVILVESLGREFIVHRTDLPEGTKPNDYLDVQVHEDRLHILGINEEETDQRQQVIKDKMAKLRQKNSQVSRRRR